MRETRWTLHERDAAMMALHHSRWWGHQALWAGDIRTGAGCSDCSKIVDIILSALPVTDRLAGRVLTEYGEEVKRRFGPMDGPMVYLRDENVHAIRDAVERAVAARNRASGSR